MNDLAIPETDQPVTDGVALMQAVARAASNPAVDVEKMERLFAMHERMADRQARQAFADAMKAAQAEMPSIYRASENQQTSSRYADLEAITKACVPVYTRHGFSLSFGQADCPIENCIRVTCEVSHAAGHSKSFWYDNPIDDAGIAGNKNKTPTHGRASATSYARRYLTILVFNLTLSGEDDDGNGVDGSACITFEQADEIETLLAATNSDKAKFLELLKAESVDAITAGPVFDSAIKTLRQKQRAQQKAAK